MDSDGVNVAQTAFWDGDSGRFWAEHADRFDAMLAPYTGALLDAAEIGIDDRVLDVGCGFGPTTLQAARRATGGSVLGVDLSGPMLADARRRAAAEGLANVEFRQADAQTHPFPDDAYDVVLSRFGVMFFDDPQAAFANLRRALRPGGRLALVCWQSLARNENRQVERDAFAAHLSLPPPRTSGPGALSLADPDHVRSLLCGSGFEQVALDDVRRPLYFGRDADDAASFMCAVPTTQEQLDDAGSEIAERIVSDLRGALGARESSDGVLLGSAAWVVSARRS